MLGKCLIMELRLLPSPSLVQLLFVFERVSLRGRYGRPGTQRITCLSAGNAGIKGIHHHVQSCLIFDTFWMVMAHNHL